MAVGPLVVAGRVDERIVERLEVREPGGEVRVVAAARAVLDVAEVHDPADGRVGVDLGDLGREGGDLRVSVRDVSDDGERLDARAAGVATAGTGKGGGCCDEGGREAGDGERAKHAAKLRAPRAGEVAFV